MLKIDLKEIVRQLVITRIVIEIPVAVETRKITGLLTYACKSTGAVSVRNKIGVVRCGV